MISRAGQSPRLSQGAGPGLKATVQSVEREITSFVFLISPLTTKEGIAIKQERVLEI